jgi:hypothetical protein
MPSWRYRSWGVVRTPEQPYAGLVAVILPNREPKTLERHEKSFYAPSKPVKERESKDDQDKK